MAIAAERFFMADGADTGILPGRNAVIADKKLVVVKCGIWFHPARELCR
jgi:hypothetical protein